MRSHDFRRFTLRAPTKTDLYMGIRVFVVSPSIYLSRMNEVKVISIENQSVLEVHYVTYIIIYDDTTISYLNVT